MYAGEAGADSEHDRSIADRLKEHAVLEWNECGGFGTVNKNNLIPYDVSEEDMENRKHRICMRRKVDE